MQKNRIEIKWGLIFVAMGLVWMALERLAGLHDTHIEYHPYFTNLVAIPSFVVYALGLREKRIQDYGGKITYQQAFVAGLIMTAVVTVLTPLSQYLTSMVITPHYFENAIAYAVENKQMTQPDAESHFSFNNYLIQSMIFAPVMGIITSAIMALFSSRK